MPSDLDHEITASLKASFDNSADKYERRTGGCTRAVAKHVLSLLLPLPPTPVVLDNACGTAAFTHEIKEVSSEAHIHAVDASSGMIDITKSVIQEKGWQGMVELDVMDGRDLRFQDSMFDISVTNFGIFFFPDPVKGAREIYRTLKPGGKAAVTTWKFSGMPPVFYAVQDVIQPATPITQNPLEKWEHKATLENTLQEGGFTDIKIEERDAKYVWKDPERFLAGLVDNCGIIVGSVWSDQEKAQLPSALQKVLTEQPDLCIIDEDGNKAIKMVAWIAIATK